MCLIVALVPRARSSLLGSQVTRSGWYSTGGTLHMLWFLWRVRGGLVSVMAQRLRMVMVLCRSYRGVYISLELCALRHYHCAIADSTTGMLPHWSSLAFRERLHLLYTLCVAALRTYSLATRYMSGTLKVGPA